MPFHQALLSFNSGELSPYLWYRTDVAKTSAGAARMRNFLPMPFGAITKRPGTRWLKTTLEGGLNSKAFPFTASDGTQYILHFTVGKMRVYRLDGTIAETRDFIADYTWPGTYSPEFSIRALQMEQVNDVAILTHPEIHPLRVRSINDTTWRLDFWPFVEAPMLDENLKKNRTFTVAGNPVADTWANGEEYSIGDYVFTSSEWECIDGHTAESNNKPGEGANWKDFWRRRFFSEGDPITILSDDRSEVVWGTLFSNWTTGQQTWVSFAPGAEFNFGFDVYRARTNHTSTEDLNPTTDPDNWERIRGWGGTDNEIGDRVFIGEEPTDFTEPPFHVYRCIQANVSSAVHPGDDADWEDFWVYEGPLGNPIHWYRSGDYPVNFRVARKGRTFVCIQSHMPLPSNAPGTGSDWETYWEEISRFVEGFAVSDRSPGKYWRIAPERDASDFQVEIAAINDNDGKISEVIAVQGGWNFFTYGLWWGTFRLQRSTNGGKSWKTIRSWQGAGDRNVADSGTEDGPSLLRLRFIKEDGGDKEEEDGDPVAGKQRGVLIPETNSITGYALTDEYVSPDEMRGTALTAMLSGETWHWSEGAFDETRGFPRALCLHGFRLWFAATRSHPVSLWASRVNDFSNFEDSLLDDGGMFRTLAASNHTPIRWLASSRRLFLGTSAAEWVEGSETNDTPITPTNVQFRKYGPRGSCPHQPVAVAEGLLFLGRHGARLYQLTAAPSNETFMADDLSQLAEHLTAEGITGMAYQQTREPVLWATTLDGSLLSLSFHRTANIIAWAKHTTSQGSFRDVVVLPSDGGDDQVFFMIDRGPATQLERFPADWQATMEAGTIGSYRDAIGLFGGGYEVTSELAILPVDMVIDTGATHSRRKRANEISINVFQSWGGGISYAGEESRFEWSANTESLTTVPPLESTWKSLTLPAAHLDDLVLSIVHRDNKPFTVRALVLRWQLHEP